MIQDNKDNFLKQIKAEAKLVSEKGFNVFPIKDKKPVLSWKKWITNNQTQQEFNSLPWTNANGWGVVCGTPNKEGLFLAVIDYDPKAPATEQQK